MRIALAGKGGAGKTTIAATLARLLAAQRTVVAIDGDSNPNLAAALGVRAAAPAGILPPSLVSRRLGGPALRSEVDEILDGHAVRGPDGVRLLLMGMPAHADEGCMCAAHATVSALLADLGERDDVDVVIDMEASPEHFSRGTTRHADVLLLVTEPYYRALETVRRMALLAAELSIPRVGVVANKVRGDADVEAVGAFCERHGLALLASIPRSDAVLDADAARVPLLDHAAGDAAARDVVGAIARLGDVVCAAAQPVE